MIEILSSVDFWKFAAPLLGAVVAWFANEWRKRIADQYQRKEANYKELVKALRGFYIGATNADALKLDFLNQLNAAWLYCPDEIIKKGYAFLDTVHAKETHTDTVHAKETHTDEAKEASDGRVCRGNSKRSLITEACAVHIAAGLRLQASQCTIALTWRSRGTRQQRRAPQLYVSRSR